MMPLFVLAVGLVAQACFAARILVQWVLSERKHRLVSPTLYWVLSLIGSALLFYYGDLRDDFAIIVGQFLSFYIYIVNLHYKGVWRRVPALIRWVLYLLPLLFLYLTADDMAAFADKFLRNSRVPLWLLLLGTVGQIVFASRFIYQVIYSIRRRASLMSIGFWVWSIVGSLIIFIYAVIRLDWVLMLGQSFGLVAYVRNVVIGYKALKVCSTNSAEPIA